MTRETALARLKEIEQQQVNLKIEARDLNAVLASLFIEEHPIGTRFHVETWNGPRTYQVDRLSLDGTAVRLAKVNKSGSLAVNTPLFWTVVPNSARVLTTTGVQAMTAKPETTEARALPYRVETSGELEFNAKVIGLNGDAVAARTGINAKHSCEVLARQLNAAFAAGRAEGEALAVALEEVATHLQGRFEPNSNHESAFRVARAALARWRQSSGGGR